MNPLTHAELVERACRWLSGTKRCEPVLSGIASCEEVPDAIGWSSNGSIVVECKTTITDFYADAAKYHRYKHPNFHWPLKGNGRVKKLLEQGYEKITVPNMGDYRYFLCESFGVIEKEHMADRSDHGLLHVKGRQVRVIVPAPRREKGVDYNDEIRYLRFALIHLHHNLLSRGCKVNLRELTKWKNGLNAIQFPVVTGVAQ